MQLFLSRVAVIVLSGLVIAGCTRVVPELDGLSRSEAVQVLAENGIAADFREEYSESVPSGQVIRSLPSEGNGLDSGERLEVMLSRGPEPESLIPETPELEVWWPSGFAPVSLDLAARFTSETYDRNPCGYSACKYWVMEVVSKDGCPRGLFVEINILKGSLVVGSAIDSLASLRPGQIGEMVFTKRDLGSGTFSGQFATANCY